VLAYSEEMKSKKFLVAINKVDLIPSGQSISDLKDKMSEVTKTPVFLISALTGTGLDSLLKGLSNALETNR
jgi:GTPase involved in cell partitioning and DNA repair